MQEIVATTNRMVLKALVVDDSPVNRAAHVMALSSLGYAVSTASNGLSGVAWANETKFDVITMDVQMPIMNGLDCTRQIRLLEHAEGRRATIIGVSATDSEEDCLAAGMDCFLKKPASPMQLCAMVRTLADREAV